MILKAISILCVKFHSCRRIVVSNGRMYLRIDFRVKQNALSVSITSFRSCSFEIADPTNLRHLRFCSPLITTSYEYFWAIAGTAATYSHA